jgi:hypothetical protein
LRAGSRDPHCGHIFSHSASFELSVCIFTWAAAFFWAAKHSFLGASAKTIAHCGWMPPGEYDRCPQTGHFLLFASTITGVGFFSLTMLY